MFKFSDLKIKIETKSFVGDKMKIDRLFNREIVVHDYKIEPSKFPKKDNEKCLYLQVAIGETKYFVTTGSMGLMQAIELVPKSSFPFVTTIVKEHNDRYMFT